MLIGMAATSKWLVGVCGKRVEGRKKIRFEGREFNSRSEQMITILYIYFRLKNLMKKLKKYKIKNKVGLPLLYITFHFQFDAMNRLSRKRQNI